MNSLWPIFQEKDICSKFWNKQDFDFTKAIITTQLLQKMGNKKSQISTYQYSMFEDGILVCEKLGKNKWVQLNTNISIKLIDLMINDVIKVIRIKRNQKVFIYLWTQELQQLFKSSQTTFFFFKKLAEFCFCQSFEQLYSIQDLVGKGGFSKVYQLCPVNRLGNQQQYYAGKVYSKNELMQRKDLISISPLIKTECEVLKKLKCQFTLNIFEIIQLDDVLIIVTELLKGGSLYQLVKQKTRVPENESNSIILRISIGLQSIHNLGYVHRDLKLENILLHNEQVKIIDFGFAEKINREQLLSGQGTLGYMAPEIFEDEPYTEKSDLFSLGVIYYALLTGKAPFRHHNQDGIKKANKQCEIDFSEYRFINVSKQTLKILKGLLQKNPDQRISLNDLINQLKPLSPMVNVNLTSISLSLENSGSAQLSKNNANNQALRSLYQPSQQSLSSCGKQQRYLNPQEPKITKTSSFRKSFFNLQSLGSDEDLEDNDLSLPSFVQKFLEYSMKKMNEKKFF